MSEPTAPQTPEAATPLKTVKQWERRLGFEVISYDGFRDLNEHLTITEEVFRERLVRCTQNLNSVGWQLERARNDYAFLSVETDTLRTQLAERREAMAEQDRVNLELRKSLEVAEKRVKEFETRLSADNGRQH